jgi:carboxylate-amine ligase
VQPRLEHTLTLAALTQALTRMLWRLSVKNQRWRIYDSFLVAVNRWRAQRYGTREGLIDFGLGQITPFGDLLEEIIELIQEDAAFFEAIAEIETARDILRHGTSAERHRQAYAEARDAGHDNDAALQSVVRHLIEEYHADL